MGLAIGLGIATAATQVASSVQQSQAIKAQADAEQKASEFNATIAEQDARFVEQKADADIGFRKIAQRKERGSQAVAIGASGFGFTGSNLDILQEQATNNELELPDIRLQADLQTRSLRTEAALQRSTGQSAQAIGRQRAGAALLSGGARAVGSFVRTPGVNVLPSLGG